MTAVTTLPFGRPLTRADLDELPDDDGHRYELLDGVLLVSPSPRYRHQVAVGNLHLLLSKHCLPGLKVILAPMDVVLADDTVLQPDLIVAPRAQFGEKELDGPPLLAIEVLSPSTRRFDLLLKRDRLQSAGLTSYWLVDPDVPSVLALELRDGAFVEAASVSGDEVWAAALPFPMTIVPSSLLD